MKRSETIKLIFDFCQQFENGRMHYPDAEALLSEIEEAGMLPPDRAKTHPDLHFTDYTWEEE